MADTILDRLEEYTQRDPLAPILFDEVYTKGITYHQLDEMSGRVYAWLKRELPIISWMRCPAGSMPG